MSDLQRNSSRVPLLIYKSALCGAAVFALAMSAPSIAADQPFPSKPLRLIVPFPPGGGGDITGRILAEHLSKGLGQPVIVDNRPGAGAMIGYELGARAPGDGHTLLMVFPSFVINPAIRAVSFDPIKDFKAVGQVTYFPMAIVIHPSVPTKSLREFIALARTKPGELVYGSPGAGTLLHLVSEMFRVAANVRIVHAPYKGGGPAVTALAGGEVSMLTANVGVIAPFVRSGKARALVVTARERVDVLPSVPTVQESGYPQLESTNWIGFVVPGATPPSAIGRLNTELGRALRTADVEDKFKAQGMLPSPTTPEQFTTLLLSEAKRYTRVVREAGIKVD